MDPGQPESPLPYPDFGYNFPQLRERKNLTLGHFLINAPTVPVPEDLPFLNLVGLINVLPSEVEYLRAEYSYRLKKYASLIGMEDPLTMDEDVAKQTFLVHHRNILLNFLLPKVTSQPLEPNLIYEIPNIFRCNPRLIQAIFGMPVFFFTCPIGPVSAQDFTRRGNPLIGRWTMEPLGSPISIGGTVVGVKRTYRLSAQDGVVYKMDMYRVNELQAYVNIGMAFVYRPGWALMRMYTNEDPNAPVLELPHVNLVG